MSLLRGLATRLLCGVARLAPERSRVWALAMLRELEFVESDWEGLWWALGGTTAILKHSGREWMAWCFRHARRWEEQAMEQMGKKAGLLAAGALGAVLLVIGAFCLLYLTAVSFPGLDIEHSEGAHFFVVLVIPVAICLAAVLWLWRKKRPAALGILLSVAVFGTHVAVHFANHFNRH